MIALMVFLAVLIVLDVAALRWGANSRDDRPETVNTDQRVGKLHL
jgi:hypothetical protein